jgi:tripartite-type tricarboxylate transporter receptor subunit TctC
MAMFRLIQIALSAILANAGIFAVGAAAQTPAEFYKGRQLDMVIVGGTGGGVDIFGRLVARHIVNYIP